MIWALQVLRLEVSSCPFPMRAYRSHNHRKAYWTMQLRSTHMLPMETAPTSPGVLRTHPRGPQMKPPSPKTTLVPLPPATMTSKTACQPTLPRKSSGRTRMNLRIHLRRRRERGRPSPVHARGSNLTRRTNTMTTGAPRTQALREASVGSLNPQHRTLRPKPTLRSPSSLSRHPNVLPYHPLPHNEYPSTAPDYCFHLEPNWAQTTPPHQPRYLMTSPVNLLQLSPTSHTVSTVRFILS